MASSVSSDNDDDYDSDVTCGSSDTDDKDNDSYDSGNSSNDDDTGNDEDSEEESDDDDDRTSGEKLENVMWCGPKKNLPVLVFRPECNFIKVKRLYATGEKHHLAYKIVRTDCRVIRQLLHKHGFHEVHPNSSDFNLMWIGSHVKPYTLRSFTDFQKINHFPRSYEITRKDRLYKNFQRMQHAKGSRHFDFLPQTFCTPSEYDDLVAAHNKERGTWIVKPVASSRGRGIFLINSPQNVPLDAAYVVCRYLNNPLLIDGFKFDLRLYVAVTSYDPLRIYLYEEGLTRFATVQYQTNNKTIKNTCMHLTNYSLNKKSNDYVKCDDGDIEDYGNKWSLGAMLRYLKKQGKDAKLLLSRIEEAINKTIICAELPVATACKMFLPYRGNCFELYGFDILVDANLKPWVLEVNLSPSLACEAPIDMKIKSNVCGDLFSLTGFVIQDPVMRRMQQSRRNQDLAASSTLRQQKERIGSAFSRQRPNSAGMMGNKLSRPKSAAASAGGPKDSSGLTLEERKIVLESKEEYARRGGWMRTFPSPNSMEKYGSLMESRNSMNQLLHSRLFSNNVDTSSTSPRPKSAHSSLASSRARQCTKMSHGMMQELQEREVEEHLAQLLRKLSTKDNSGERRSLRNRVRNKFPATKRLAPNPRNAVPSKAEVKSEPAPSRAPLTQGKLDSRPQTGQSKNSAKQPEPAAQQTTTANTAAASQQQQQRPPSSKQNSSVSQSNINSTKGVDKGGGGSGEPTSTTGSSGNWVHGKPPVGPSQGSGGAKTGSESSAGARMVLEVQKPKGPTKEEIREMVNVPDILDRGGDLSKLQARDAFATYLLRVQQRLLAETSKPPEKLDEIDQHDEQMDLVLRFLKRAASNLQQQFKVIVPSRKLPIHDRRRILAKQLVDFVQIYSKETEEMENQKPKKVVKPHNHHQFEEDDESIDYNRFTHFVGVANENELEELLTTYTKQNKSASIFLGTSTNNPKSISEMMAQPTSVNSTNQPHHQHHHNHHHHHQQQLQQQQHKHGTNGGPALLHRRSSSTENLHSSNKGGGAAGDIAKDLNYSSVTAKHGVHSAKALQHYYAAAGASNTATTGEGHYHHHQPHQHPMTSSPSTSSLPKRPHSSTPNTAEARYASSADGAVQVYSARFNRQRPYSAKAGFDSGDGRSSGRPNSAVVYRDSSGGQIAARHFSESSQQAIQEALLRLAKRQAARQYSSSSVQNQNLLTQKYVEQHFGLTNPPQGPVQATPVTGYGSNPVLTSTLGRSSSRARSGSVGHVRSPSQNSITAVAVDAHAGSTVPQRSASNSRVSSAALDEKGRSGASREQTGHIRRSSHSGVALNRTHSFTMDTSSKDSSELSGPTNAPNTSSNHGLANGLSDDAYSAQIKALQNLTVSNRTPYPNAASALQHQQEGKNSVPIGGGRQMSGGASRPMSLQEQQQMAYELSQQSKAKHQEKVAQAHTNASALRDAIHRNASASVNNNSSSPSHQPRPPPQSANARKPISTKRLARTTQVEEGPRSSGNSFYTGLKYNNTTGGVTNKHHNGTGSIQAQVIRH